MLVKHLLCNHFKQNIADIFGEIFFFFFAIINWWLLYCERRDSMVYAMGDNKTFTSRMPVKTRRVQSEQAKEICKYLNSHKISVHTDSSGTARIKSEKV